MIGKDIEGNEYELYELTDEEKTKLKERLDDCRGAQLSMLIMSNGIAVPSDRADSAKYYGGLAHEVGEEQIIVNGERYTMWEYYKMEEAHYNSDYRSDFDFKESNVWYFYLGPLDDAWWEGDE